MTLLRYLYRSNRRAVLLSAGLGAAGGLVGTGTVAVLDRAIREGQRDGALLFAAMCLVSVVLRSLSQILLAREVQNTMFRLRLDVVQQIIAAPLADVEQFGPARIYAMLTEDIDAIGNALPLVVGLVPQLAVIAGCLVFMAWTSPLLFLATVLVASAGVASFAALVRLGDAAAVRVRDHLDSVSRHIRTLTDGIKELKQNARRRRAFLSDDVEATTLALRRDAIFTHTVFAIANSWGQTLFLVVVFVLVFVVPSCFSVADAAVGAFTLATLFLARPVELLLAVAAPVVRASVAVDRLTTLGLTHSEPPEPPVGQRSELHTVELRGIEYRYPGRTAEFQLGPIDLTVGCGEVVFVVGGNGSGKSTLVKLLAGLYRPCAGQVLLDGAPVGESGREQYRQLVSVIHHDSLPFRSLEGVAASAGDIAALLRRFQLDEQVQVEGRVLSTTDLSQGQRKRLLLIAALLEDRPLYVFDEWTADQDPGFRHEFYHRVVPSLRAAGKAVVVISHDDRYFAAADRLVVLDRGRLARTA